MGDSQGARVFFGQRGQEDVGKVDEQSTDGLFGCVEKPGKDGGSMFHFHFLLGHFMSRYCPLSLFMSLNGAFCLFIVI